MFRCLVWGTGEVFSSHYSLLKFFEEKQIITVVAVTGNNLFRDSIFDYRCLPKDQIDSNEFDIVIVMARKHKKDIENEARTIGFLPERIISYHQPNIQLFALIALM